MDFIIGFALAVYIVVSAVIGIAAIMAVVDGTEDHKDPVFRREVMGLVIFWPLLIVRAVVPKIFLAVPFVIFGVWDAAKNLVTGKKVF